MKIEEFIAIFKDESIKTVFPENKCNALMGLNIIAKYLPHEGINGADHDVIYACDIEKHGKRYDLGVYPTERDAVIAYNSASKVLHGEFSYMNELPKIQAWNKRSDQ